MTALTCSMFIFWFSEPHDSGPFVSTVLASIPAWFGLNAVERWAIDRPRAINGNTS